MMQIIDRITIRRTGADLSRVTLMPLSIYMLRVAIIGGGISGLSTCYYLAKLGLPLQVFMFEGANLGGWIQTVHQQGFAMDTGPRSFRVSPNCIPLLDICSEVGILDQIICSHTSSSQSMIYYDSKMHYVMPGRPFPTLKMMLYFPVLRRTILKNIFNRNMVVDDPDFDLSIEEFLLKSYKYIKEEDKKFIIYGMADGLQLGIYSGDIAKLSARTCSPFSFAFKKKYFNENNPNPKIVSSYKGVQDLYKKAYKMKSSSMNFKGGMEILPKAIYKWLETAPGFKLIPETVIKINETNNKPVVVTTKSLIEVDHVISTIPSHALGKLVPNNKAFTDLCNQIPHNSIQAMNLGFEKLDLKGVGYLVPAKENSPINGVLYDSCTFPNLKPSVSIMAKFESTPEQMIDAFKAHTGVLEKPVVTYTNKFENSLPQYNVGHFKIVESVKKLSPSWLSPSGQSFYLSGIPNCVLTAKSLIEDLVKQKVIK